MRAGSDHIGQDARHAARSRIRVDIARFTRRMDAAAYAFIKSELEAAEREGRDVDGTELGYEAARVATAGYISPGEPQAAIEAGDP